MSLIVDDELTARLTGTSLDPKRAREKAYVVGDRPVSPTLLVGSLLVLVALVVLAVALWPRIGPAPAAGPPALEVIDITDDDGTPFATCLMDPATFVYVECWRSP